MTLAHPNGQPLINKNGLLPGASGCVTFQPCDRFGGFPHLENGSVIDVVDSRFLGLALQPNCKGLGRTF
jgi:hypothetical protein